MDIENLISELTDEEKAALVSGTDFMDTNSVPRLGIPSVATSDGPHGLRKQIGSGDNGVTHSEPATTFPPAVTSASSWNPSNTRKMGDAISEECRYYGVNVLLGPAINIKKNPLCGRNFEYFSEDPLLAGEMSKGVVDGLQKNGVGACVKHFALNNNENYRFMGNSICDERAMREIYLKPFEKVVKDSRPYSIMCAYNKINGTYCSQNKWLLTDVLRNEWGFDGLVMTDWGAMHDRVASLKAGLDLEMPGDTAICRKWILDSLKDGSLEKEDLDDAVRNVLTLIERTDIEKADSFDIEGHDRLSCEIAEDSAVLLKNDGSLPLNKEEKIFVTGELFENMRYQGAGSSMINSTKITTPKDAFDAESIDYEYVRGYSENKTDPEENLIKEAAEKSKDYRKVLVFIGLTDYTESEGGDRENMSLPENQIALINALINEGKEIIAIFFGGSPVELPFNDSLSSLLCMYLPGQAGGRACFDLLYGNTNPSGKLAETWVKKYEDVPFGDQYATSINEVYRESIFVGYRYYVTSDTEVRYPFGYGLSYTGFSYSDMEISKENNIITVSATVTNSGDREGAEVVELYSRSPDSDVFKPVRELRAFEKVYLEKGESRRVTLIVDTDNLRYFNTKENRYVLEEGIYDFEICSDCLHVILNKEIYLEGEKLPSPYTERVDEIYKNADISNATDEIFEEMSGQKIPALPPKKPITLESRFSDLNETGLLGKILYKAVLSVASSQMKKVKKMDDGPEKDNCIKGSLFLTKILNTNSLISMSMSGGKSMPYNFAEGFMHFGNGHFFKGIKCFCTKIKVPKLPKEEKEGKE